MRLWKTVGERGSSVQIWVHGGRCYIRYWDGTKQRYERRSLKHSNRARAEEQARELADRRRGARPALSEGDARFQRIMRDAVRSKLEPRLR